MPSISTLVTDPRTLRWRSRLRPTRPSSEDARYVLRYRLAGILVKDGDRYKLDHDFAFPDREGMIRRFALRLTLDPAWQPETPLQALYTAGTLAPGESFVLTIPMRFAGSGTPIANDGRRPPEIQYASRRNPRFLCARLSCALHARALAGPVRAVEHHRCDAGMDSPSHHLAASRSRRSRVGRRRRYRRSRRTARTHDHRR